MWLYRIFSKGVLKVILCELRSPPLQLQLLCITTYSNPQHTIYNLSLPPPPPPTHTRTRHSSSTSQRLIGQMGKKELLRLNWWQRSIASVPSTLLNYCCEDNGIFDIPSSEALMKWVGPHFCFLDLSVRPSVRPSVCASSLLLSVRSFFPLVRILVCRITVSHTISLSTLIFTPNFHYLFYFNLNFNLKCGGTLFTFYSIRIFSNFVLSTHETHCNIAFCQIPSGGVHVRYSGCDRQSVGRLGEEHRWTTIHPIKYRHLVLSCDTPTLSFLPSHSYPTSCHPSNFSLWNLLPHDIILFISHDFYPVYFSWFYPD